MDKDFKVKLVINGNLADADSFNVETDGSDTYVYEVIRVIDGKVLFAEEHYQRLAKSLEFVGKELIFTFDQMLDYIESLINDNEVSNDNIKLIVDDFRSESAYDVILTLMNASYPSADDYRDGVRTELYKAVRLNPQIKRRNQSLRDATDEIIREKKLFELILVDNDGDITEGSRSNIFFIKEDKIYTSPAEKVLLGVTRMKVIEVCRRNGYEVIEEYIPAANIVEYDAAFISGTSPKVLPIRTIDDLNMDVNNPVLRNIMELFDTEIANSLTD